MFDLTLTPAARAELNPLKDVLLNDDAGPNPLEPLLTQLANDLTEEDIEVRTRDLGSEHLPDFGLIIIGLFDHGDEQSLGGETEWLASVYATLCHELAHVLHSSAFPWLDDPQRRYAANLLEDGRVERRMVEEHPQVRPWLRHNVLLGRDEHGIRARASTEGWPHELIMVGTRKTAGVIDDADFTSVRNRLPPGEPVQDLVDVWVPVHRTGRRRA